MTSSNPTRYIHKQSDIIIRYPHSSHSHNPSSSSPASAEQYHLLELPPDLANYISSNPSSEPVSLTIKGRPSDDAVLCTTDKTYQLRSISVSNSLLVLDSGTTRERTDGQPPKKRARRSHSPSDSPPRDTTTTTTSSSSSSSSPPTLHLRSTNHQILELLPTYPRTHRISSLLRPSAWRGLDSAAPAHPVGGIKRYTKAQLESVVQASLVELEKGLRERNVVEVDGYLMMLPSNHLVGLLSIVLSLLTIHGSTTTTTDASSQSQPTAATTTTRSAPTSRAPVNVLTSALVNEHDLPSEELARAVLRLFSVGDRGGGGARTGDEAASETETEEEEMWECDLIRVVREIGVGLLVASKDEPMTEPAFIQRWEEEVGHAWSWIVDLKLLKGEYLLQTPSTSHLRTPHLVPFSRSHLPIDPATRFSELFLTRSKWRAEDMEPFLVGLTPDGDKKALEKMVGKFVRVVKEGGAGAAGKQGGKQVVWWFPRRM